MEPKVPDVQGNAATECLRGLALAGGTLFCMACSTTMVLQTVSSPVVEQRSRVDLGAPVIASEWSVVGDKIVGRVSFAACVSQRRWATEERRVVHRRPIPALGWAFLAAGAMLVTVGLATNKAPVATVACSDDPQTRNLQMLYGDPCGGSQPDNTASDIELLSGALAIAVGIGTLALSPSDQTTSIKREPHAETVTQACIAPGDLATLALVLKLGEHRFLHVAVNADGFASIDLPSGIHLTPGAEVPIVVYRAPPAAASVLPRWQVVGLVHVPE